MTKSVRRLVGRHGRGDALGGVMRRLTIWMLAIFGLLATHGAAMAAGASLDLSNYQLSFEDTFSTLSISGLPGSGARWFSHTPWSGDFGDARFADPGPDGPFSSAQPGLKITASKGADGRWSSGLISSRDRDGPSGRGFTQALGYFEIKTRFPSGSGLWPAFWLIGTDKSKTAAEIDIVEFYGGFPAYYHVTAHLWKDGKDILNKQFLIQVDSGILSRQFNTFGVSIDPQVTTFYFNRQAVAAMPTPTEYRQPFYILANLAMGGGWPIGRFSGPQTMEIAYVRAYQIKAKPKPG